MRSFCSEINFSSEIRMYFVYLRNLSTDLTDGAVTFSFISTNFPATFSSAKFKLQIFWGIFIFHFSWSLLILSRINFHFLSIFVWFSFTFHFHDRHGSLWTKDWDEIRESVNFFCNTCLRIFTCACGNSQTFHFQLCFTLNFHRIWATRENSLLSSFRTSTRRGKSRHHVLVCWFFNKFTSLFLVSKS